MSKLAAFFSSLLTTIVILTIAWTVTKNAISECRPRGYWSLWRGFLTTNMSSRIQHSKQIVPFVEKREGSTSA